MFSLFCYLILEFGCCLMACWLFCFLWFSHFMSLTGSCFKDEPWIEVSSCAGMSYCFCLYWGPAGGGGPGLLVGILKCLMPTFCQGFRSLSEIERHTFVLVGILIKFVYSTRYTNCAANQRYLAYFLLFMSFYEFWSSKKITIRQTGPNYFNSLSLIFGFEVTVFIS